MGGVVGLLAYDIARSVNCSCLHILLMAAVALLPLFLRTPILSSTWSCSTSKVMQGQRPPTQHVLPQVARRRPVAVKALYLRGDDYTTNAKR